MNLRFWNNRLLVLWQYRYRLLTQSKTFSCYYNFLPLTTTIRLKPCNYSYCNSSNHPYQAALLLKYHAIPSSDDSFFLLATSPRTIYSDYRAFSNFLRTIVPKIHLRQFLTRVQRALARTHFVASNVPCQF